MEPADPTPSGGSVVANLPCGSNLNDSNGERGQTMVHQQSAQAFIAANAVCFHYRRSKIMTIDWALVILAGVTIFAVFVAKSGQVIDGVTVAAFNYGLLLPLYVLARLGVSTICVDENAISSVALWYRWRIIQWQDVRGIRTYIMPSSPVGAYGKTQVFLIDQHLRVRPPFKPFFLPGGPISFSDKIVNSRVLLDLINANVTRYRIPIRSLVSEAGGLATEPRPVEKL